MSSVHGFSKYAQDKFTVLSVQMMVLNLSVSGQTVLLIFFLLPNCLDAEWKSTHSVQTD